MTREWNDDTRTVKKSSSCFGRRTVLEKILLTLVVFAAFAIVTLATSLYVLNLRQEHNYNSLPKAEALRVARSVSDSEPEVEGYFYEKPSSGLPSFDPYPNLNAQQSTEPELPVLDEKLNNEQSSESGLPLFDANLGANVQQSSESGLPFFDENSNSNSEQSSESVIPILNEYVNSNAQQSNQSEVPLFVGYPNSNSEQSSESELPIPDANQNSNVQPISDSGLPLFEAYPGANVQQSSESELPIPDATPDTYPNSNAQQNSESGIPLFDAYPGTNVQQSSESELSTPDAYPNSIVQQNSEIELPIFDAYPASNAQQNSESALPILDALPNSNSEQNSESELPHFDTNPGANVQQSNEFELPIPDATPDTYPNSNAQENSQSALPRFDANQGSNGQQNTELSSCSTRGCVRAAFQVIDLFDEDVDPCDNFYEFACGNFLKTTTLPADKATVDSFSIVRDLVQDQLKIIFNEPAKSDEAKPFKLAKNFYHSCLNQSVIEERGHKPLADILEEFGGWPVVKGDSWTGEDFDWVEHMKKFRMFGLQPTIIFTFRVLTDEKDSTKRVMDIDQTFLELEREFLTKGFDDKIVQSYYKYMVDNAVIFGADRARAEQELKESLEFEAKLAKISLSGGERRNASALHNPTTIKKLQQSYPYLNWLDFINSMLPSGLTVDENEVVINSVPKFFDKLGEVLASTPKRTIANYILWRIVAITSGTQTEQLRDLKFQYYKDVYGLQSKEERWKECITYTAMSLPISVGALYVRKYFPETSKQAAISMVKDIHNEFLNVLHNNEWMDEATRAKAIEKAEAITTHIGYPNELTDVKKLEELYEDLEIEPDNLLLNTLRLRVYATDYSFNQLRKPVNKTDWVTHSKAALVNAYYNGQENSIQFPAAILQDRFFAADRPRYMNYAAIGQVIGHEITHGFDDKGRQFDSNGNLDEWWDPITKQHFYQKAKCIIDQYGNYTDLQASLKLNGVNTQGENIADNGGTRQAYIAYNNWLKLNKPEDKLPGLKYTQEQLFWISSAQMWCAVSTKEFTVNKIKTGVHSPNEFRVNGVVSNLPEFASDFNCPIGSNMNPVSKCRVW